MNDVSQETLHKVEHDDATLTELKIGSTFTYVDEQHIGVFNSSVDNDLSRLGRYIGENTQLEKIIIDYDETTLNINANRDLLDGLRRNSSIKQLKLVYVLNLDTAVGGELRPEILNVYEEKNSLLCLRIDSADFTLNGGDIILANALKRCTNLQQISLHGSNMTDENLQSLVESIRGLSLLEKLDLQQTRTIGSIGCQAISTLLEDPHCNLLTLNICCSGINNIGAVIIANSLANNNKLKEIFLHNIGIGKSIIEDALSNILCNATSVNSLVKSNHTLEVLYMGRLVLEDIQRPSRQRLVSLLQMNKGTNKRYVAIKKILRYHPNLDVTELFSLGSEEGENTLKALPFLIDRFDEAREAVANDWDEAGFKIIERRKLSGIYQFALSMPMLFVPSIQTKEGNGKRKRTCT